MPKTPALCRGFHHVAFRCHDFDGAVKFYREGLGFKTKCTWGEGDGRAVMLDGGRGNYVEIFASATPDNRAEGSLLHFALLTDDCDAALAKARAAGAQVTAEPATVDVDARPKKFKVRIAFCKGPAGEVLEFFQQVS